MEEGTDHAEANSVATACNDNNDHKITKDARESAIHCCQAHFIKQLDGYWKCRHCGSVLFGNSNTTGNKWHTSSATSHLGSKHSAELHLLQDTTEPEMPSEKEKLQEQILHMMRFNCRRQKGNLWLEGNNSAVCLFRQAKHRRGCLQAYSSTASAECRTTFGGHSEPTSSIVQQEVLTRDSESHIPFSVYFRIPRPGSGSQLRTFVAEFGCL